ncbi:RNA polymerase sigma factor [Pendulispora albinea]|uniref:Sigma-70 family RNA polymerase sigma factor n=1 Tax=Pendulispora albinea TaxID=2741071 RepID=A0ABZ2M4Q1_9BACT
MERARSRETIAERYWKAIYKYVRLRWQKPCFEAEELVQEFFVFVTDKNVFAAFDPRRARFRTFVRLCVDRFVISHRRSRHAKKRGGAAAFVPFEVHEAENELGREHPIGVDPEQLFEAEWLRSLFQTAVASLRAHCTRNAKEVHFRAFELFYLTDGAEKPSYERVATTLGISVVDVNNRLVYARRHFRSAILATLRACTATDEEMNDEARLLLGNIL